MIKISKYYCKGNWQSKVYKPKIDDYDCDSPEWLSMKLFIFTQQKCKCAMCKKELSIKYLTLHHIKSRAKGGKNDIDNLIGLCVKCHDIIEPQELNRNNIVNYYNIKKVKKEKASENDWHMWVYGGFSRPGLKDKRQINKPIDIIGDIIKKTKYEYPDNILLKEEYVLEGKTDEYTLKYGFTLEEIANILKLRPSTVRYNLSFRHKEKKIIDILNNFGGVQK